MPKLFWNVLKIVSVIKKAIVANRDGNWPLHVDAVGESIKIYGEFDAYCYLRIGSWYYESINGLEKLHPSLYRRFKMDILWWEIIHVSAFLSAVAPDVILEWLWAPASVGKPGADAALTEVYLLFHEILAITNLF